MLRITLSFLTRSLDDLIHWLIYLIKLCDYNKTIMTLCMYGSGVRITPDFNPIYGCYTLSWWTKRGMTVCRPYYGIITIFMGVGLICIIPNINPIYVGIPKMYHFLLWNSLDWFRLDWKLWVDWGRGDDLSKNRVKC